MSRLNPSGQDLSSFQITLGYQSPSILDNHGKGRFEIILPDNRIMEFEVGGMATGYKATVVLLHGSPLFLGCSTLDSYEEDAAELENVRLIAPKRPGYSRSSLINQHCAFGEPGPQHEVRTNAHYMFDLLALLIKLGIQKVGLLGHSAGSSYVITAAALFEDAKETFISRTNPPKIIPEITAIGVRCGSSPYYIWRQMSDLKAVRGPPFDRLRDDYAFIKSRDGHEFIKSRHGYLDRTKPGSNLPQEGEQITDWAGYYQEDTSIFSADPGAEAWGFELREAGRFVAADGNGIRYWYGYMDPYSPSLIGLRLAEEVGGPFIFKTATHANTGFQGDFFDLPSKRLVYRDMLEAMCVYSGAKADVAERNKLLTARISRLLITLMRRNRSGFRKKGNPGAEQNSHEMDLQIIRSTQREIPQRPNGPVSVWRRFP